MTRQPPIYGLAVLTGARILAEIGDVIFPR
jgi:hypothetical protein